MSQMLIDTLKSGGVSTGPFLKLTDPAVIEIMALAGFSHAVIDLEHGPISFERAQDLVRAARLRGLWPTIRVPRNEPSEILRALDIGAEGVHVPHVDSVEAAQAALDACFFRPQGDRGVCRFVRAAGYSSISKQTFFASANEIICPILHIEGTAGIEALPDILRLKGIGVVFLGPYDLSQSCGVPGQVDHPRVVELMKRAVVQAREAGVTVGTFVDSPAEGRRWREAGVRYICISVDVGILYEAAVRMASDLR